MLDNKVKVIVYSCVIMEKKAYSRVKYPRYESPRLAQLLIIPTRCRRLSQDRNDYPHPMSLHSSVNIVGYSSLPGGTTRGGSFPHGITKYSVLPNAWTIK